MARPGVSYQDIASAANELRGQGKNITIENVRNILGTGSIGTINHHLRKWKEVQVNTQQIATKENLPESLIALIKGLWEGIITQSTNQFQPLEESYKQEISALSNEMEKYKNNNQRWQKMFNQWQQEKQILKNEKLTLDQALEFSHKENATLNAKQDGLHHQLQEKQERIDELHRLHQQAQHNLEHYRESMREQRLLDQQQFDREKQELQSNIKNMQEQLLIKQQQYSNLQQKNILLQQTYTEIEKKYDQMTLNAEALKEQTLQLEKVCNEYQYTQQYWQRQYEESEKKLENRSSAFITLQANNQVLSQQLIEIKQLVVDTKDQHKLLANEKLILIQEKAQLEGQLKQMQVIIST
jgi:chromosome segregation ATPase